MRHSSYRPCSSKLSHDTDGYACKGVKKSGEGGEDRSLSKSICALRSSADRLCSIKARIFLPLKFPDPILRRLLRNPETRQQVGIKDLLRILENSCVYIYLSNYLYLFIAFIIETNWRDIEFVVQCTSKLNKEKGRRLKLIFL